MSADEPAVAGACLDEIEGWGLTPRSGSQTPCRSPHLGESDCEQLAEERADIDAGKKIARAAGSLGRAGVVTELGIVEREVHERGDRERAAAVLGSIGTIMFRASVSEFVSSRI